MFPIRLCAVLAVVAFSWAAATEAPWAPFKAPSGDPLDEAQWKRLEAGEVFVALFDVDGTNVKRAEAAALLAFPADQVFEAVRQVERFPEFMPYVSSVEMLDSREGKERARFKLDLPWPVGNRHYVVRLEENEADTPAGNTYISAWEYEPESGNIVHTEGAWVITSLDGGRCFLQYTCFTDTGGRIPVWLRNKATDAGIPKLLNQLRKTVAERQEEKAP